MLEIRGETISLRQPEVRLPLRSRWHEILSATVIQGATLSGLFLFMDLPRWLPAAALIVMVAAWWVGRNLETALVIHNGNQRLVEELVLFGRRIRHVLCPFRHVRLVTVSGRPIEKRGGASAWQYATTAVLRTGRLVRVTDFVAGDEGWQCANGNAKVLARFIGAAHLEGRVETTVETTYDATRRRLVVSHVRWSLFHRLPRSLQGLLLFLGIKLLIQRIIFAWGRRR